MVDANLRRDDGKDAFVLGTVGHQDSLVGLEGRDHFIKLGRNGSVGTNADLFVSRQDGDFDLVLLRLSIDEFVVLRKGPENGVCVAFLRVGNTEFQGGREDVSATDNGSANGGFETKVVVSVYRQHQCSCHPCTPRLVDPPPFFHSNPCAKIPSQRGGSSLRCWCSATNSSDIIVPRRGVLPILVSGQHQTGSKVHKFVSKAALFLDQSVPIL